MGRASPGLGRHNILMLWSTKPRHLELAPMRLSRPRFTVRRLMFAVEAAALSFAAIRWVVTDAIQVREYTYSGNTFVFSRRLGRVDDVLGL